MASWATPTQNAASWATEALAAIAQYLLTPDSNYILVGSASDEFMVFSDVTDWTSPTKN